MAQPVRLAKSELVTLEVRVDGTAIPDTVMVQSVSVTRHINRMPKAALVISDGDPAQETFAISASGTFVPGNKIDIRLGYQAKNETVFKGVIVRQTLKLDAAGNSVLEVGCTDKAMALTLARRARVFADVSVDAVLSKLISDHGLKPSVDASSDSVPHILQAQSSDWDLLVALAEAHGCAVDVHDGTVTVARPDFAPAQWETQLGRDLIEMDLELDAVSQYASVTAASWDFAGQAVVEGAGSEPGVNSQGNLSGSTLAGVLADSKIGLQTPRLLDVATLKTWSEAQLLKSRMARFRGMLAFPGNAAIKPGVSLDLAGLGARFNGAGYVTGIRHEAEGGTWKTTALLGFDARWFTDTQRDVEEPAAAARSPGVRGLQIGKVVQVHGDPDAEQRIKVSLPLFGENDGIWMRLASLYAGVGMGLSFLPEVDDEVVIGFLGDDPDAPLVLGALHSSTRALPFTPEETNKEKSIVTRSKLTIRFDDESKVMMLETPDGNTVTLSDEDKSVTVVDANDNTVTLEAGGITLKTPSDLTLSADGKVTISGQGGVSVDSPASVSIKGMDVKLSGDTGLTCKGGATAELSGGAQTKISGGIVQIN